MITINLSEAEALALLNMTNAHETMTDIGKIRDKTSKAMFEHLRRNEFKNENRICQSCLYYDPPKYDPGYGYCRGKAHTVVYDHKCDNWKGRTRWTKNK